MKNILIAAALVMPLTSCVTSGDLQQLADAQALFEVQTMEILDDQAAGVLSDAEAAEALKALAKQHKDTLVAIKDQTETRTKDFVSSITDAESVAGMGLAAVLAFLGVNRSRDRKRQLRGEPTGAAPPKA